MSESNEATKSKSSHLRRFYQKHIEHWRQSQLSQVEYCRQNQIIPHRFTYWKRRLDDRLVGPAFVPVPLLPQTMGCSSSRIDLVTPGGFKIQINPGFDATTLKRLIQALGSL